MKHTNGFRRLVCLVLCMAMIASFGITAFAENTEARRGNQNYYSNQGALQEDAFTMLPLGAVQPKEWLKEQLLLQKEGLLGNMQDNYPIYSATNGWRGGNGDTWEKGPYYFRGLTQTAFVLNDEELKAKAMEWIDWTLDNQRENGFMGPLKDGDGTSKSWDWWPRMVVLLTLQDYYEATEQLGTPDERVLPFLEKYFRYQLEHITEWPLSQYWDEARGGDNLEVILWLYNRIYDASNPSASSWLIELANKLYQSTYKWTDILLDTTTRHHVVNTTQGLKTPAVMYQVTGGERDRTALRYGKDNYSIDHGRIDGLANADESARENYPYRGTELCSVSEDILSESISMRILGEGWIGDDIESLAYNSLPAAYSPDLTNMTYYQAQNQVMLTHGNHDFDCDHTDDIAFGAYSGYECCFPNGHMGWPKFVQSMWMGTNDNGLAVVAYGPNTVTAKVADGKTAVFDQTTSYPFDETVTLTYNGETAAFPLKLRIPGWCSNASIKLNGKVVTGDVVNGYLTLDRTFTKGDTVELVFPMEVRLSNWFNNAVAVEYGPLIYSLKVQEDWHVTTDYSIIGGRPHVEPFTYKETYPASGWNYALVFDENDIQGSFEVVKSSHIDAQPFNVANAPVTLKVKGQLVPDWKLMGNNVPEAPYSPLAADTSLQTEVELIPTGCSRMHMTQLPFVGEAKDTVVRDASTAETFTDAGVKTVQFDNIIVPDADNYDMTITYSGSGSLTLNVNTKYSTTLSFAAGQNTVTVNDLKSLVSDSAFRFCYDHYNRVRFIGNDSVTIEKIEVTPRGTFEGPKVLEATATTNSAKLRTNIDRADGFYTVRYGTVSGEYTMTSSGYHQRTAYVTGLTPNTTYYMQVEMRVRGVLTTTEEFTVKTRSEGEPIADEWSVPGAFSDDFDDENASRTRWEAIGEDSAVSYGDSRMHIGVSTNIKAVAGQKNWRNYTVEATLNVGESTNDCGVMFRVTNAASGADAYNGYYVGIKEGRVVVGFANGKWNSIKEVPADVKKNTDCVLKVVVVGNQFAICVDGKLVDVVTPSVQYENGQVGLRSWNNAFTCGKFEVRAVSDEEKDLFGSIFEGFTDDFSDAAASSARWNALGESDKVSYADGKLNVGSSSNIKVVAGDEAWTDYVVEGTFVGSEAKVDENCGLMFRVTGATGDGPDSYNGYYVGLGKFAGVTGVIVGYGANSWNFLEAIPYDYQAGQAYTLKVVVSGNQFAIYVDGQFLKVITNDRYSRGCVGVRSYNFPFTCDDVTVRSATAAERKVFATGFQGFEDHFDNAEESAQRWSALGDSSSVSYTGGKLSVGSSTNIKVVAGETDWTDYVVEGTFVGSEAKVVENCGLMFRVTGATGKGPDSYNGYYVGLGVYNVRGVVVGYGNGNWNHMKTIPFDYKADTAYKLKVAVLGDSFAIYVDDVLMGIIKDARFTAGQIGVRSYAFPFSCDDFVVRAVSASEKQDIENASTKIKAYQTYSAYESAQVKFEPLSGSYTYKLQYGTEPGVYTGEYVDLTTKHSMEKLAVSGLENGKLYYVRVVAVSGGAEVAYSDELTVTPGTGIDDPSDEVAKLESLLTEAKAIDPKSDVLIDRIALAEKTLGLAGVNRMDLSTARACLKIAMDRNSIDYQPVTHEHKLTAVAAKDATCTEAGNIAYWTCECGKWFSDAEGKTEITDHNDVILNALGHDWKTEWNTSDTQHWHECSRCDLKNETGLHTWNEGEITTPATETENGVKTFTCTVCDRTKTEIIPAIGHQHKATFVAGKAATCSETGLKDAWYCKGCGKYFAEEACTTEIDRVIAVDPTNHVGETELRNAKVPTYTEDGYTGDLYCLGCGQIKQAGSVIPRLNTPVSPVKPSNPAQNPHNPSAGENVKKFPFADVPSTSWYYDSVREAWENGLIDGVTANEFKPDSQLTVAQAIKLAAALHQMQKTGSVTLTNGSPSWYDSYVAYAVNNGVIENSYLNYTKAQMNAPATRGEFVHIFNGALVDATATNTVADNKIPDVKTTDKYGAEIYKFYRAGITVGSDAQGTFHPASNIKRSEVAAIVLRMFDTAARKSITLN